LVGICRNRNVRPWLSYYFTELVVNENISLTGYSEKETLILRKFVCRFDITAMCRVYSALKLLFYVSKVLGFAPYTLLENGVLVPSRAAKKYSIFLCIWVIASKVDVYAFIKLEYNRINFTGLTLIYSFSWVTHLLAVVIVVISLRSHKKISQNNTKI